MTATAIRIDPWGGPRQARWQQTVDWPLTIAAILFLVAYSLTVIADVDVATADLLRVLILVSWALFPVSYLVEISLADHPWQWVVHHPLNLLFVLLPLLRPLRLLRVVARSAAFQHSAGTAFRARVLVYLAGTAILVTYIAALAVLDAERADPNANITTFGDSIWWAAVTITTVGYGDFTPLTLRGRIVATALMLGGVAVLGVLTATLSSWIVQRVSESEDRRK
ncbi:two pore domain potassium channel family protein [Cryobacterium adonitolivorans]|uniref:Two pore domain potassium channel family protein n=1 Tax=Cryobacterium adonitolivorans TaxID=1259189 RepID=A0A4R8VZA0_9MICO|nr:potassium channel family protein [Cryobacterium adonitolivorans]TFB96754.1 two pore domain potassium channel family protein [Cryobacterium adonitolivorans]